MDTTVINVECVIITVLGVGFALALLLRFLKRSRPELAVGKPLAVGFVLRLVVIALVSLTGAGATLRGTDERQYLVQAHQLAHLSWTSAQWLPTDHSSFLHVLTFAAQIKLLGSPEGALRITQVGISLAGVLLIVAAVYDLAGRGAARLAAWLLSLEVASLFFNGLLLKEPLVELASGMIALGATRIWWKLEPKGIALMALGGLIALGARQYVGWFLLACATVVVLHAALRQLASRSRALPAIFAVAAIVFVATPAIIQATSNQSLQQNLQPLQTVETGTATPSAGPNGNNLALAPVDFSSRGAVVSNLPSRVVDLLLRPYPWQVANTSQVLGAAGSLVALTTLFLLIRFAWLSRGQIFGRAGPLLYPFLFLVVAYALATGNAGQGFRYRTHLVTLALAAMVVLRAGVLERREHDSARAGAFQVPASDARGGLRPREAPVV